jgi:hypothetical protein
MAARRRQRSHDFVPPEEDPILDVKEQGGAKGDGRTDDTAALRSLISAGKNQKHPQYGSCREIFIPSGTYLVSDTINIGDKKKLIIGQSRERTVIRLKDNCPGFQDPGRPRPVINYGGKSYNGWHFANNFNQRALNFTIDVGSGNPGAIGMLYHTNNLGSIYHITIRAGQGSGKWGLYLGSGPGPGLCWDVDVTGFEAGVRIDGGLHSMTLGKIAVRGQRRCGYLADGNMTALWNLTSENRVPAVIVNKGHFVLCDAKFTGGSPDEAAIRLNGGCCFVRNVESSGYGKVLVSKGGKGTEPAEVDSPSLDEFVRPRSYTLFGETQRSLNLPVEEPPLTNDWGDPAEWTVIKAEEGKDSAAMIQEAIDDGAETIYLAGWQELKDTIHIRKRCRRIMGTGYYRSKGDDFKSGAKPLFRIEDGVPDTVYIEIISDSYGNAWWKVDHASRRTLVCRNAGGCYRNSVTGGKAFFLDGGPGVRSIIKGPNQRVWAWQTNTESYDVSPHILNEGGMLFVCGYKIEKDATNIGTRNGGFTEVMGGLLYKNRQRVGMRPAFFNHDSNVSVSIAHYGRHYDSLMEERRRGGTKNLTPQMLGGQWVPLYSGWTRKYPGGR